LDKGAVLVASAEEHQAGIAAHIAEAAAVLGKRAEEARREAQARHRPSFTVTLENNTPPEVVAAVTDEYSAAGWDVKSEKVGITTVLAFSC
jgi:hypothetical protein